MKNGRFSVPSNVTVEFVDGEALVVTPGSEEVQRFSGDAALAMREIMETGRTTCSPAAVDQLLALGVVESSGLTRRSVLVAGGVGVGAGLASFMLPSVALASSVLLVQGDYYVYDGSGSRALEVRIPGTNGAPAIDFPEDQGAPSALSVSGFPSIPLVVSSPRTRFDDTAVIDGSFQYDSVSWQLDDISVSSALTTTYGSVGSAVPSSAPTLTADFTWGTFSYRAQLTYFVAG